MKTWLAAALLLASPAFAQDNPMQPSAIWDDLHDSVAGLTEELGEGTAKKINKPAGAEKLLNEGFLGQENDRRTSTFDAIP